MDEETTNVVDLQGSRAGRDRRSIAAVAVAAVLLVVVLAVAALWWTGRGGGGVVLYGDSITMQTGPVFERVLGGEYEVTTDGIPNLRSTERVESAATLAEGGPDQVIINLGTNDILQSGALDEAEAALDRIGTTFAGARCVHLVTVNDKMVNFQDKTMNQRAADLNRSIRELAGRQGWGVVPWDEIVRDYDAAGSPEGPLTSDTVHPTDAVGQPKLAEAYRQALDGCS